MAKRKERIIIDTNLWISFLLTKKFDKLDSLITSNTVTLIFSDELMAEFIEVASRPKFKKYFFVEDLEDLIFQVRKHALFVQVNSMVDLCRDPKDNFLLSLAKDGKAGYLLTGDKDLLELGKIGRTKIVTMTYFIDELLSNI